MLAEIFGYLSRLLLQGNHTW
ncbi:hypothetical protein BD01_0889 [Thermococcus nautili]|uniref:Uncharacterized protein n=1 Tax=Thermococcus nautili TaxID=195522 RepID=W8P182_9EURY|nr:hypothetical protein BD01_0889 [Thermococcus nautili]